MKTLVNVLKDLGLVLVLTIYCGCVSMLISLLFSWSLTWAQWVFILSVFVFGSMYMIVASFLVQAIGNIPFRTYLGVIMGSLLTLGSLGRLIYDIWVTTPTINLISKSGWLTFVSAVWTAFACFVYITAVIGIAKTFNQLRDDEFPEERNRLSKLLIIGAAIAVVIIIILGFVTTYFSL